MQVLFRFLSGKSFLLDLNPDQTLGEAENKLKEFYDFSTGTITFVYKGQKYQKEDKLDKLNYTDGFIIVFLKSNPQAQNSHQNSCQTKVSTVDLCVLDDESEHPPRTPDAPMSKLKTIIEHNPPECIHHVMEAVNMKSQTLCAKIRNDPRPFLKVLGLDPGMPLPFVSQPPLIPGLAQGDIAAIRRLSELGFDEFTVAQVYLSCNKDEQLAANCLINMGC